MVRFSYIYISQGSVEIRLCCGGMYNNFIVANCPQSVSERIFENRSLIGEDMDKSKVRHFLWPSPTL